MPSTAPISWKTTRKPSQGGDDAGLPIATDTVGELVSGVRKPGIRPPSPHQLAQLPAKRSTAGIHRQYQQRSKNNELSPWSTSRRCLLLKFDLTRRQFVNGSLASLGLYGITGLSNFVLADEPQ